MEKGKSNEDSTLLSDVTGNNYVEILDSEITIDEIVSTANKHLKDGKSTSDGWVKKMLTNLPICILYTIQLIFNMILKSTVYPTKWRTTAVSEIFKNKGDSSNASNYRPISLVPLLSKLFDFILCNRFTTWFKPNDSQTAYQKKKSTADHVFFLRCIIQECMRKSMKLYIIAVDFDGAFDRISRSHLIRKLVQVLVPYSLPVLLLCT